MTKKTIAATIDIGLIEKLKDYKINVSGEINTFLHSLVTTFESDSEGIDLRLEYIKLEKALKKITHWQTVAKRHKANIELNENKINEKKEKDLENEKIALDNAKRCKICNNIPTAEKYHNVTDGIICHACYMSTPVKELRDYI